MNFPDLILTNNNWSTLDLIDQLPKGWPHKKGLLRVLKSLYNPLYRRTESIQLNTIEFTWNDENPIKLFFEDLSPSLVTNCTLREYNKILEGYGYETIWAADHILFIKFPAQSPPKQMKSPQQ